MKNNIILVLDGVINSINIGAISRTAEVCGITRLIVGLPSKMKKEKLNKKFKRTIERISCGSSHHLEYQYVEDLDTVLLSLCDKGYRILGLECPGYTPINEADWSGNVALVLGSEKSGLRNVIKSLCDNLVYIPMRGKNPSFNVHTATAIACYVATKHATGKV